MARTRKPPSYWVMDLGNTRTKLAPVYEGKLGRVRAVPTLSLNQKSVAKFLPIDRSVPLVLASVVPVKTKLIVSNWKGKLFALKGRNVPGLAFNYPKPAEVGADRLANAVAAKTLYGTPVVVMDFGTCLTVEVINREGAFCGGAIAPGWNLTVGALAQGAALVPHVEWKVPKAAIAKSTRSAVQSGCYYGYRGFIKELLAEIKQELGLRRVTLILTGGQGAKMASTLPEVTAVNPLLTLEGLRIIGASLYGKSN